MHFTEHKTNGIHYFTASNLSADRSITHAFSTRLGGVSIAPFHGLNLGRSRNDDPNHVRENYMRFSNATNCNVQNIVMVQQVHSDTVILLTKEDAFSDLYSPTSYEADALVTNCPNLTLAVFYADCVPVLLYDPVKKAIAAIHSGWRGTSKHITGRAIETMQTEFGSQLEDILIAIGPSIGPCCFETHEDVPNAMRASFGNSISSHITPLENGKYQVDISSIISHSLVSMGVPKNNITQSHLCTTCHPNLFWSHRSMGDARGNQCAMIQINE